MNTLRLRVDSLPLHSVDRPLCAIEGTVLEQTGEPPLDASCFKGVVSPPGHFCQIVISKADFYNKLDEQVLQSDSIIRSVITLEYENTREGYHYRTRVRSVRVETPENASKAA